MFENLAVHSHIAVTGSHRSGTTIAAKMIAADTGHTFVDAREFTIFDEVTWRKRLQEQNVVVQCPSMLRLLADDADSDIFVVLMRRPYREILDSCARIGVGTEGPRASKFNPIDIAAFWGTPEVAYNYWDQRPHPNSIEVQYSSLSVHPMWVPKTQRRNFEAKQTERSV